MPSIEAEAAPARLEPQFQLSGVLGDYWFRRTEKLPSRALVDIAADFGVTEASARQAMRRLVLRGTLVSERVGRSTSYGFPERTPELIASRLRELIESGRDDPSWDGRWTLVTFSVPEETRDVRRALRSRLRALGFGSSHGAVWASPHDRREDAAALLDSFEIVDAHVFRADRHPRPGEETDLADSFDVTELRDQYLSFIERYRDSPGDLPPQQAMTARSMIMYDWRAVRRTDPDLPPELLGPRWPRAEAYKVFRKAFDALGPAGEERFKHLVARYDPALAELAGRHV